MLTVRAWIPGTKTVVLWQFMRRNRKIYSVFNLATAIFLMVTLLWLTVSTPFIFASQQHLAKQNKMAKAQSTADTNTGDEEAANPFGNSTEEKAPSSNSFSEEYLHDTHTMEYFVSVVSQYHKCDDAGTYTAFHGELLVPPPNMA